MGNNLKRLCVVDDDKELNYNDFNLNDIHINPNYLQNDSNSEENVSNEGKIIIY